MQRHEALQYVGYCVDDALSPRDKKDIPMNAVFVGWQCGFEPMFVAVWSYLGVRLTDDEAEEIATVYLKEIDWLKPDAIGFYRQADHVL